MSTMLGAARSTISGFSDYAKTHKAYEHAYHQERKMRFECARAYEDLHGQYNGAINELNSMYKNNRSLHKQLETAQQTMQTLQAAVQEQSVKANNTVVGESDLDRLEWALEKERLEAKIADLEKEKSAMAQDHHIALANAADHIREVTQRADELQKLHEGSPDQLQPLAVEPNMNNGRDNAAPSKPTGRATRSRKRKTAPRTASK
ncbi:hypothetical protein AYO20_07370 [Fonsecaea nubica]|uniref:Uncharacterized protein n=1 Tax=Fonsecaea nubica TaxID=856822 RepID=A0A178CU19_9EURO|nr:hypothetical protein AYO20_07370 [Fonsecaea nubica]OAL33359.1 hypothetical protein AYO20_07370 [Fonsecaea nubica]